MLSRVPALIRSPWLSLQLKNEVKRIKLLDCSWSVLKGGKDDFLNKHIPGAAFFDLNHCVTATPTLPRNLPDPECFQDYVQSLGINKDSHIIVYDRGVMLSAARSWWTFRAYGHEQVSVLDGGLCRWETEGLATTSEQETTQRGDFEVNMNKSLIRNFKDMVEQIGNRSNQIVDARRPEHFSGLEQEPSGFTVKALQGMEQTVPTSMSRGHIPGAKNLMEDYILDPDTKCLLPKEELIKIFREHDVDLSVQMTTMCYNGHAATLLALAAHVCGQENTSVYYGSWTEWGQKASPAMVTGPTAGVQGG